MYHCLAHFNITTGCKALADTVIGPGGGRVGGVSGWVSLTKC